MPKKRRLRCPKCGSLDTKRDGFNHIVSVDRRIQRLTCFSCGFTGPLRRHPRSRQTDELNIRLARESLERASLRILARRHGLARNTVMMAVRRVLARLPRPADVAAVFHPRWSGVLVFDGKVVRVYDRLSSLLRPGALSDDERRWLHKSRWLVGVDHGTGDLPHYCLAEGETKIDLVIYFRELQALGYALKAVVCDGNADIPAAARLVFGDGIAVQLCTRHFLEGLRSLLPPRELVDDREATLALIARVKAVIEADNLDEAARQKTRLDEHVRRSRSPVRREIIAAFRRNLDALTTHLTRPDLGLPHTSNDAENLIRQLALRLKTVGRFMHRRYAEDYLNAWALLRRFTAFTDCRGGRRCRNGKAPLKIAGCEIGNIDPMRLKDSHRELRR